MKTKEIRELTDKELFERIDNEVNYLRKLRLNHAISPLENPHKISGVRKNIARMKTELRQRQLSGQMSK